MEVVGATVGSALIEPFRVVFGSIYGGIKNLFNIRSNYNNLEREMAIVSGLKCRLREAIDDDELQHHLSKIQVQDWLGRVEEVEKIFNSVRSAVTTTAASSCACSSRCKLGNRIVKQIVKAKELIENGKSFENMIVGVNPVPKPRPVQYIEVTSIKDQPTASRNLATLMDVLKNEEYKRIGVWGMGGVGKTTLVKNLNNELTNDPTFNYIIWATVSQNASVESIQSKIAEKLQLNMDKEVSKETMASHLYNKLKGERFLLILDDIWEEIDLDILGIPQPNECSGRKILLTTREFNVCQQMLTDIDFQIGHLHPQEAWKLFCERAGEEVVNDDQIKPLAEAIVEECDGLPLAIVTVGASLRKKREIGLRESALHALQKSDPSRVKAVEEKVYKPLKWSYDSLQGAQLKSCFLFLCLFPEDFEIGIYKLVQYWLAEGLIDESQQNFEQLQNEVLSIVDNLKDSCLLESGLRLYHVKMHDIVRDVGVWIAKSSEDGCKCIIKAGHSETRISEQMFNCSEGVRRVSFMESNIAFLPNCNLQCPEASTLFLQGNKSLLSVPDSFLPGFQMLRILDLSDSKIKSLPDSVLQLGELRALFLERCTELVELPSLAALGMLQVLNCSRSAITKLPEDFEELTNLRQLDLSHTHRLKKIPSEKISNLLSLEFLDMTGRATKWGMRKVNEENIPFEKLLCLDQLIAFHLDFEDISYVTDEHVSWLGRIRSFTFNVTHNQGTTYYDSNVFNTKRVVFSDFLFTVDESVRWLLVYAFYCEIDECKGVDLMLGNLVRSSVTLGPLATLKHLSICCCCISVKPSSLEQCDLLPHLEYLDFAELSELESLSDFRNFLGLRFTKLKYISVRECYQLQNLLTMDETLQKLERVETITIRQCGNLTEVFKSPSPDNFVPSLQVLLLEKLPALEEICKTNASWQSLKWLNVRECNMLQKLPLAVQSAENIQSVSGEKNWWDQLQWDNERFKMCLHPHFKPCD